MKTKDDSLQKIRLNISFCFKDIERCIKYNLDDFKLLIYMINIILSLTLFF